MHIHNGCQHELEHCAVCDVVYCKKCGKEWHNFTVSVPTVWIGGGDFIKPDPVEGFRFTCTTTTTGNTGKYTAHATGNEDKKP